MEHEKSKNNSGGSKLKKQTIAEWLAVLVLCIIFGFTIFKVAYGANAKGYNTSGYCYLDIGPNHITVNVSYAGTAKTDADYADLKDNGSHRDTFLKSTHIVHISGTKTAGDISVSARDVETVKDTGGYYTTIFFNVTFLVPAHYYFSGTSKVSGSGGAFKFTDGLTTKDYPFPGDCRHWENAHYETLLVRLNLSNTHMIVDSEAEWHNAKLVVDSHINTYTFTYYTNGGTVKDLNEGTESGDNVVYSRSCGAGLGRAPLVERSGYVFDGWYYDNGIRLETGDDPRWPTNAITLCYDYGGNQSVTARWTAHNSTVNFDLQGGSYPEDLAKQTELNGYEIIPNGTYYMKSNCGTNMYVHVYKAAYESKTVSDSDPALCIYSGAGGTQTKWIFERYKDTQYYYITSVHNGLALSLTGHPAQDQSTSLLELWSHEKEVDDYLWYLKDEGNGHVAIYNKSTNKCLDVKSAGTSNDTPVQQYAPNHSYAQWWDLETVSQQNYPTKTKYGNHRFTTPTNNPVRGMDKFLGWDTNPNATTPTYKSNDYYTATPDGTVTLYAIYQSRARITFDANGGSTRSLPKPMTVNVGEKFTLPDSSSMARNNYVMIGWSPDPHAKKNYISPGQEVTINKSGEHVMYAVWQNVNGNADLSNVISGNEMFKGDSSLQGGDGTTYNSIHDGLEYAHPDGGADDPGYYTEKDGISQSNSGE